MTSLKGFTNSAKLALANIGLAGDKLEALIAALNPDAAIPVGHDEREAQLNVAALKLAEQRQLQGQLETTLAATTATLTTNKVAAKLSGEWSQDPTKPKPSEKAKQDLVNTIISLKEGVEHTETELAGVKTAVEYLEHLVQKRAEALRNFNFEASTTRHRLDMANLRESQAKLEAEMQRWEELQGKLA